MNLKQFKTTKDKVRALINEKPYLKDDDNELCLVFWGHETGCNMAFTSVMSLLDDISSGWATPQSTILRARRQLNQLEPETRGKSYKGRKENEEEIRKNINK